MRNISFNSITKGYEALHIGLEEDYLKAKIKSNQRIPYKIAEDLVSLKKINDNEYYTYCKLIDIINQKIEVHNKLFG